MKKNILVDITRIWVITTVTIINEYFSTIYKEPYSLNAMTNNKVNKHELNLNVNFLYKIQENIQYSQKLM